MSGSQIQLEYPAHRYELMGRISMLASPNYQRENWINPYRKDAFWYYMMNAYSYIFDDTCFGDPEAERPEFQIGALFYNKEELQAVKKFAKIVDDTITAIGDEQPDSAYIDSPLWNNVVDAAKEAYAVLDKKGGGKLEDVQGK